MENRIQRASREVERQGMDAANSPSVRHRGRGSVVATLDNAVVRQGDFVLGPVSLQVDAGERIRDHGPQRGGEVDAAAAPARSATA